MLKNTAKVLLSELSLPVCVILLIFAIPLRLMRKKPVVFLMQPASAGSLGDQAMMTVAAQKIGESQRTVTILGNDESWKQRMPEHCQIAPILGNTAYPNTLFAFLKLLYQYKPEGLYVVGADVMDGCYSLPRSRMRLLLLWLASAAGLDSRLLGFSFNEAPPRKIIFLMRIISHFVKFYARDPVSFQRLQAKRIRALQSADLAFLLKPRLHDQTEIQKFTAWAEKMHSEQRPIVALNVNYLHVQRHGGPFLTLMKTLLKQLLERGAGVVMIAHDIRISDGYSDEIAMRRILSAPSERTYFLPVDMHAEQIKHLVKNLDLVVTGRMHLAIASLGQAVPVVMFGYQGKQEGLAQLFDLDPGEVVISPTAAETDLVEKINQALDKKESWKKRIQKNIIHVMQLSELNFN